MAQQPVPVVQGQLYFRLSAQCHYDEARSANQSDKDRQLETQRAIYRSGCLDFLEAFVDHQIALEMVSMPNHLM